MRGKPERAFQQAQGLLVAALRDEDFGEFEVVLRPVRRELEQLRVGGCSLIALIGHLVGEREALQGGFGSGVPRREVAQEAQGLLVTVLLEQLLRRLQLQSFVVRLQLGSGQVVLRRIGGILVEFRDPAVGEFRKRLRTALPLGRQGIRRHVRRHRVCGGGRGGGNDGSRRGRRTASAQQQNTA